MTDLVGHLRGATMSAQVVLCLIEELRGSGYAGYTATWNGKTAVEERMSELYVSNYDHGPFIPQKLR